MRKLLLSTACFVLAPLVFLFALIITLTVYRTQALNNAFIARGPVAYAALPTSQNIVSADIGQEDGRTEKVRQFFARYNSDLEPYAADVVAAADEFGLDFRLIPAIAMKESTLCKRIPVNSFNCWGFGIYGDKVTRFANYKEGIYTVTKALATRYKSKGLVTPEQIMTMYTPSSDGSWAVSVNYTMRQMQ